MVKKRRLYLFDTSRQSYTSMQTENAPFLREMSPLPQGISRQLCIYSIPERIDESIDQVENGLPGYKPGYVPSTHKQRKVGKNYFCILKIY